MPAPRKPRVTLTCEVCGKSFEIIARLAEGRRFCSKRCNLNCGQLVPVPERRCVKCGTVFYARKTNKNDPLFCSRRCANGRDQIDHPERPCENCGQSFSPKRNGYKGRFCSFACVRDGIRREPKTCPHCRLQFQPATTDQKFCSVACQRLGTRKRVAKTCRVCGADFEVIQAKAKRASHCSKRCVFRGRFQSGSEDRVVAMAAQILGEEPDRQRSFPWLVSDLGRPMHFDAYFPGLSLALEYDGAQHRRFVPGWFKSHEDFERLQERDRLKDRLCSEHGITMLRITDEEPETLDHIAERIESLPLGLGPLPRQQLSLW